MGDFEIKITNLKYEYATHILNNQDKFNKDHNSSLNSTELKLAMKEFGKNDVSELLKGNNDKIEGSIFEEGENGEKLINIMRFKDDYASAILNNQDKLNSNYDAYISESELKEVLKNFGKSDVSELLEPTQSETTETNAVSEETKEPASKKTGEPQVSEEENIDTSQYRSKFAINETDSGANKGDHSIRGNITLSSSGTPFAAEIEKQLILRNKKEANGQISTAEDMRISAYRDLVEQFLRDNTDAEDENLEHSEKIITYGSNNDKKALLRQTIGTKGAKSNQTDSSESSESLDDESDTTVQEDSSSANIEAIYNLDFETLNSEDKGNWLVKFRSSIGSQNSDFYFAADYNKKYKDGGIIDCTIGPRVTVEHDNNITELFSSVDYKKNKFSTGAYGLYHYEEVNGERGVEKTAQVYGKYGKSVQVSAGIEGDEDANYYYLNGTLSGEREFPNRGISLKGRLEAEYGFISYADSNEFAKKPKNIDIKAMGGFSFKGKDLSTDVVANVAYGNNKYYLHDGSKLSLKSIRAYLLGKISTKYIDFSTTIAYIRTPDIQVSEDSRYIVDNKNCVSSNTTLGIKKIFGEKIIPTISFNTADSDQNIGAGIIVKMK